GQPAVALGDEDLVVEIIDDYADGRQLLRITVPVELMPSAGRYGVVIDPIVVTKPVDPGVYENIAQVFYDSATLSGACAAGEFGNDDTDLLRGDSSSSAEHCAAGATFRTITSTSGQFQLL